MIMGLELTCKKLGMTRIFSADGTSLPVTVLEAETNTILQKKTEEKDGYTALQIGSGTRREKVTSKPLRGHFAKAEVGVQRRIYECRVSSEVAAGYEVGQTLDASLFEEGQRVDVIGTSKGRGTAGVIKRHGHAMPEATHGTHENFRHGGSIGAGAWPARVIKGMKMAGQMGNARVTTRNLQVAKLDPEQGLIYIVGAVPGHRNGIVRLRSAESNRKG
jgi:large subunit ribosomal protein L3